MGTHIVCLGIMVCLEPMLTTVLYLPQLRFEFQSMLQADGVLLVLGTKEQVAGIVEVIILCFCTYGVFFDLQVNIGELDLVL